VKHPDDLTLRARLFVSVGEHVHIFNTGPGVARKSQVVHIENHVRLFKIYGYIDVN
jgi:hypothetical protein